MNDFLDRAEARTWYVSYTVAKDPRQKKGPYTLNECLRERDVIVRYEGGRDVEISSEETV